MFIRVIKMNGNSGRNCVHNNFCNTSTLFEQPLLLYIILTGVWSECNICVCYCAQGTGASLLCLLCVKTLTLPGWMFSQLIVT
jgi:hypothetical protein